MDFKKQISKIHFKFQKIDFKNKFQKINFKNFRKFSRDCPKNLNRTFNQNTYLMIKGKIKH